jgi:hypothetical protein
MKLFKVFLTSHSVSPAWVVNMDSGRCMQFWWTYYSDTVRIDA